MITNNYTVPLLLVSLLFSVPAVAGPYFGVGAGANAKRISAPNVSPAHPVDSVSTTRHDYDVGVSLSAGYRWHSWYAEAGAAYLGAPAHDETHRGQDADFTFETFATREEKARTVDVKLGRLFQMSNAVSLYAEAGVHYYTNKITTLVTRTERAKLTPDVSVVTTAERFTERNTAAMYGVGLMTRDDPLTFKVGVSRYGGVDRTTVMLVMLFGF